MKITGYVRAMVLSNQADLIDMEITLQKANGGHPLVVRLEPAEAEKYMPGASVVIEVTLARP